MPRNQGKIKPLEKSNSWINQVPEKPEKSEVEPKKVRLMTCPNCVSSYYSESKTDTGVITGYCTWCSAEVRRTKDGK
jgi:hypothetical protein